MSSKDKSENSMIAIENELELKSFKPNTKKFIFNQKPIKIFILILLIVIFIMTFKLNKGNKQTIKGYNTGRKNTIELYNSTNKNIINANNKKIVAIIFAGREYNLSILMKYLNALLKEGKISEIHLWKFFNNNKKKDREYIDNISNLHKTKMNLTDYKEIKPKIINESFSLLIKGKNDAYILINDKYEIIIGANKNTESVIIDYNNKQILSKLNQTVLDSNNYIEINIKINNNNNLLVIIDKKIMEIKNEIKNIISVKVHSGENSDIYWDYEEAYNKNIKNYETLSSISDKFKRLWGEAYYFYLDYEADLFLKIDDDILYIDLSRFDEFINFIYNNQKINFVFPNMINHAVSVFYNNKFGLLPDDILSTNYQKKNSSLQVYNYYRDGKQAIKVHKHFLENTNKYINNDIKPINLDGHRESICFYGVLKKNYDKLIKKGLNKNSFYFDDEVYIYSQKNNYFYPRFVVTHYSFAPQLSNELTLDYIKNYSLLSNKSVD